ncbi:DUF2560 family protein [Enterobacter roggenkampii]|uniref:DUF2560 family protein n=1 Tax=Enterobacter roggenkampii TaxID=1812935 RepID=UPI0023790042|nr:DUF2560 family protein [Escherichia coli]EJE2982034.1 DUF2560 family protein [Escherichia coli]ELL7344236.1 DUF2560 family protein [Escherichia coli]MDD8579980.1 DUF2560 family protein [Escherichia coli]HAW2209494.1 DUF2560 family protein [Escherichia coli]
MAESELTPTQQIRFGLLSAVNFDTAAAAEAIKFVDDDQLKYRLFIQHLNRVTSENGWVARTTKAIQEAKETLILFPASEA